MKSGSVAVQQHSGKIKISTVGREAANTETEQSWTHISLDDDDDVNG